MSFAKYLTEKYIANYSRLFRNYVIRSIKENNNLVGFITFTESSFVELINEFENLNTLSEYLLSEVHPGVNIMDFILLNVRERIDFDEPVNNASNFVLKYILDYSYDEIDENIIKLKKMYTFKGDDMFDKLMIKYLMSYNPTKGSLFQYSANEILSENKNLEKTKRLLKEISEFRNEFPNYADEDVNYQSFLISLSKKYNSKVIYELKLNTYDKTFGNDCELKFINK